MAGQGGLRNAPNFRLSEYRTSAVQEHQAALRRYFARRVRTSADLEDHVQDVFVRVLSGGADQHEVQNWPAFLRQVASSVLVDRFRRERVRGGGRHEPIEAAAMVNDGDASAPDRIVAGRQQLEHLQSAIDELDPLCRAAFRLVRIDGLTHREAAAQLGVPAAVIGRQVEKALAKLVKAMVQCA